MTINVFVAGKRDFADSLRNLLSGLDVRIQDTSTPEEMETLLSFKPFDLVILHHKVLQGSIKGSLWVRHIRKAGLPFFLVTPKKTISTVQDALAAGVSDCVYEPFHPREFILRFNALTLKKTRITCIGGGTGLFTLLMGLKQIPQVFLTSVVTMSDDGGSSGKLRSNMGVLPPGDIRRSLVALSNAPRLMNQVIQYRFKKGSKLDEHSFGNLFLAALSDLKGSMTEAVRTLGDILNIQGIVIPVTNQMSDLVAVLENGHRIKGESKIDLCKGRKRNVHIKELWHEPAVRCHTEAMNAILFSDYVIIGPGDLYTSVITNLAVKGVAQAIRESPAKKIYICNLMTKPGETTDYDALKHITEVIRYLGEDCLHDVFLSNTQISAQALKKYARKKQSPVSLSSMNRMKEVTQARIRITDIGHEKELVRHDSLKLRNEIYALIRK
jgi:uncharacterized cofD-like protein